MHTKVYLRLLAEIFSFVLLGSLFSSALAATEKREEDCRNYERSAIEQNEENIVRGCGFRGPEWNSIEGYHFSWCIHGDNFAGSADYETARRQRRLDKQCNIGRKDKVCTEYAKTAVKQGEWNNFLSCGFGYPVWVEDFAHHYKWCMLGQNVGKILDEISTRENDLAKCEEERLEKEISCQYYAHRSVYQAELNKRHKCNLSVDYSYDPWSADWGYHYSWCSTRGFWKDATTYAYNWRRVRLEKCGLKGGLLYVY